MKATINKVFTCVYNWKTAVLRLTLISWVGPALVVLVPVAGRGVLGGAADASVDEAAAIAVARPGRRLPGGLGAPPPAFARVGVGVGTEVALKTKVAGRLLLPCKECLRASLALTFKDCNKTLTSQEN